MRVIDGGEAVKDVKGGSGEMIVRIGAEEDWGRAEARIGRRRELRKSDVRVVEKSQRDGIVREKSGL